MTLYLKFIAIKVLTLKLPEFIVLALPMSILLASLMAYSRLSADSEIIALRSIGISIYRLIIPGVILGVLAVLLTFLVNDFVAPAANYEAKATLNEALKRNQPTLTQRNIIYPEYKNIRLPDGDEKQVLNRLFYAEEFNGKKMQGLTILDRSQAGINQIIISESATWNFSDNRWDFFNGTIYLIDSDGSYRNILSFEHKQLDLPRAPIELGKECKDYGEMSIFQAYKCLQSLKLSGNEKKIRKLKVRIQEKLSLPFVCLVFGLLGSVLGIKPQNTGKATSFGICVLVVFVYYLMAFMTSSLGIWGVVSPFMAAWLPNLFCLSVGGLLLVKSAH